jgi:ubiquinone/menaquinone biosynthesis C-methylase UbiE
VTAEHAPSPEEWQSLDEANVGESATSYLADAARTFDAMRQRSHELLGVGAGGTVLDVGCGTGIALTEIAALVGPSGTAVGLDPSIAMLEQARRSTESVASHVELVEGTALATGLADDRFDAVRTERVLMHVADLRGALAELARVTRPGGRLVLVEPDHRRLAVDTDDPDIWLAFIRGFSTALANISAGLESPAAGTRNGLRVLAVEPITYQFRALDEFMKVFDLDAGRPYLAEQGVTDEQFAAFLEELQHRDRDGRFLAVGVMYVVVFEKPT